MNGATSKKKNDTNQGETNDPVVKRPSPRRSRSIAIAVSLIVLVLIFYIVTLAKLGTNILNRPL